MTSPELDDLVKINKLKAEPGDQKEFDGWVRSAAMRLKDAQHDAVSIEGRFDPAYNAAHSLALAALRWQGYRSDSRYLVFQCLPHTLQLDKKSMQLLNRYHVARNRIEYHGQFDISESMLAELIDLAKLLDEKVRALGPVA